MPTPLDKAVKYKVPAKEMPSTLYIVSDMQFDQACEGKTNFEAMKDKYEKAGYKLPNVVFWCVNSYSDVPIKVNDEGVCLVSGASPAALKSAITRKIVSPYDVMLQTVNVDRYEPIKA